MWSKVGTIINDEFIIQLFISNTNGPMQCKDPAFEYALPNHNIQQNDT